KLAETTVAGFRGVEDLDVSVEAAAEAAGVSIALDNVTGDAGLDVSGEALNSVTIEGALVAAEGAEDEPVLELAVEAGKNVETVTITTAVDTVLTVTSAGGKGVSTVDASASTGAIEFIGTGEGEDSNEQVRNVRTGSGNDAVALGASLTATTKDASVSTG